MDETREPEKTAEQLAILAQEGDRQSLFLLWQRVERLVNMMCGREYALRRSRAEHAGLTEQDAKQEGYIAFTEAVAAYRPDAGAKFSTFLHYPVKKRIARALGIQNDKHRNEPLNACASLDKPVKGMDSEGITLLDAIEDTADPIGETEQRVYNAQLRADLESCLAEIPPHEADTLRRQYYHEQTLEQIARAHGTTTARARDTREMGLRRLRGRTYRERLRQYRHDIMESRPYKATGLGPFKSAWASSVEKTVERLERAERRAARHVKPW